MELDSSSDEDSDSCMDEEPTHSPVLSPDRSSSSMQVDSPKAQDKRSRDAQTPPKETKRGRNASTGAPSPGSRAAASTGPAADGEPKPPETPAASTPSGDTQTPVNAVTPGQDPPPAPPPKGLKKIDISYKKPSDVKELKRLTRTLPPADQAQASRPFISDKRLGPDKSPLEELPLMLSLMYRVHQQSLSPDISQPFSFEDKLKVVIRILRNNYMDDEGDDSGEDLIPVADHNQFKVYYSRLAISNPYELFNAPKTATTLRINSLREAWFLAVAALGHQYTVNPKQLAQQQIGSFFVPKLTGSNSKTKSAASTTAKPRSSPNRRNPPLAPIFKPGECPTDHIKAKPKANPTPSTDQSPPSTKPPPTDPPPKAPAPAPDPAAHTNDPDPTQAPTPVPAPPPPLRSSLRSHPLSLLLLLPPTLLALPLLPQLLLLLHPHHQHHPPLPLEPLSPIQPLLPHLAPGTQSLETHPELEPTHQGRARKNWVTTTRSYESSWLSLSPNFHRIPMSIAIS